MDSLHSNIKDNQTKINTIIKDDSFLEFLYEPVNWGIIKIHDYINENKHDTDQDHSSKTFSSIIQFFQKTIQTTEYLDIIDKLYKWYKEEYVNIINYDKHLQQKSRNIFSKFMVKKIVDARTSLVNYLTKDQVTFFRSDWLDGFFDNIKQLPNGLNCDNNYQQTITILCMNNNYKTASWYIQIYDRYIKWNIKNFGSMLFIYLCGKGYINMMDLLLNNPLCCVDIHFSNEYAFRYACAKGHMEVVKYLLSLPQDQYGKIDIHIGGLQNQLHMLRFYNPNYETAFLCSCYYGHIDVVKYLLSLPQDQYGQIDIHKYDEQAFRYACMRGYIDIVQYLLSLPQDQYGKINIHKYNEEAFRYACMKGHIEVVQCLLSLPQDQYGQIDSSCISETLFGSIYKDGHFDILKLLIDLKLK
jgi:ankyrin repeat protein